MLDTNVLVSAIFFGGVPGRLLDAWLSGAIELILSPEILEEYQRVGAELADGHQARIDALTPILSLIAMHATLVNAPPLAGHVCADPSDDKFLAAAVAVPAAIIVSGDRHLLDVSGWCGVTVLSPRAFADGYHRGS